MIKNIRDLFDSDVAKLTAHSLIDLYDSNRAENDKLADPQLFALIAWLRIRHPTLAANDAEESQNRL